MTRSRGELVLAADQFIIRPAGRVEETARARAAGDDVRTVIAGYHWFTDWGRDTMISLEGLTLSTHRYREAGYILRTFAHYVRDGLIPNMFPDGAARRAVSHGRRNAVVLPRDRALHAWRPETTRRCASCCRAARHRRHHLRGTRFGIRIDPSDGLFTQGEEGYQLTWMDAKVDDWVVTPRRGKAVETQRALVQRALPDATRGRSSTAAAEDLDLAEHARRAHESFNRRFWYERAAISTTSSTASTATTPLPARTSCSRSRCRIRCSIASAGSR